MYTNPITTIDDVTSSLGMFLLLLTINLISLVGLLRAQNTTSVNSDLSTCML